MGKGKGTISAKDLLGGDSLLEPFELIDRYVRGMGLYPHMSRSGCTAQSVGVRNAKQDGEKICLMTRKQVSKRCWSLRSCGCRG